MSQKVISHVAPYLQFSQQCKKMIREKKLFYFFHDIQNFLKYLSIYMTLFVFCNAQNDY